MKTIFKLSMVGLICLFVLNSCEKDEPIEKEEGLKSMTGDQVLTADVEDQIIESEVVFHKHYSADLTREEADAKWAEDLKTFKAPHSVKAGYSTEWFYNISTRTGTQTNNQTDDRVECAIRCQTSVGAFMSSRARLDNPKINDFEGGWNYFKVRSFIPKKAVQWVELKYANLYMQGTNGWFVTHFNICLRPATQSIAATGGSHIHSQPNVWLDNSTSSGWDSYATGTIGTGRLNF